MFLKTHQLKNRFGRNEVKFDLEINFDTSLITHTKIAVGLK